MSTAMQAARHVVLTQRRYRRANQEPLDLVARGLMLPTVNPQEMSAEGWTHIYFDYGWIAAAKYSPSGKRLVRQGMTAKSTARVLASEVCTLADFAAALPIAERDVVAEEQVAATKDAERAEARARYDALTAEEKIEWELAQVRNRLRPGCLLDHVTLPWGSMDSAAEMRWSLTRREGYLSHGFSSGPIYDENGRGVLRLYTRILHPISQFQP